MLIKLKNFDAYTFTIPLPTLERECMAYVLLSKVTCKSVRPFGHVNKILEKIPHAETLEDLERLLLLKTISRPTSDQLVNSIQQTLWTNIDRLLYEGHWR